MLKLAPELETTTWFNSERPLSLAELRGKVVMLTAFQMLCPGCVEQGLPQARRVWETFDRTQLAVIGLHSVFEHHAAVTDVALKAFLHEYRFAFPVAVDRPGAAHGLPRTMAAYAMQGTPTLILIDRQGRLRKQSFGHEADLRLGAEIMRLLSEAPGEAAGESLGAEAPGEPAAPDGCDEAGCAV
jgi:peroxiredoxin